MDLFQLVILIVAVGVLLFAVNKFMPMDDKIKQVLNIVVVAVLVIFILSLFSSYFPHIRVGK